MENLINWLLPFDSPDQLYFRLAYLCGVLVVVLPLLVYRLLRYIICERYPRRSQGVGIRGAKGMTFISSGAIGDLVKHVCMEFDYVDVAKVTLKEMKDFFFIDLVITFDIHGGALQPTGDEVQNKIVDSLQQHFGIDSVRYVNIRVKKMTAKQNSPF